MKSEGRKDPGIKQEIEPPIFDDGQAAGKRRVRFFDRRPCAYLIDPKGAEPAGCRIQDEKIHVFPYFIFSIEIRLLLGKESIAPRSS
jgi:hypothetical protein